MYRLTKPAYVIPMHGEPRHLETHIAFAESLGVAAVRGVRDGRMFQLAPGEPHLIDGDVPVGRLYRDGHLLLEAGDPAIGDRKRLSWNGFVAISVVLRGNGEVAADPEVALRGLPRIDANGLDMSERVQGAVFNAVDSIPRQRRKDRELVRDAVSRSVRAEMKLAWGKKPVCSVLVSVV